MVRPNENCFATLLLLLLLLLLFISSSRSLCHHFSPFCMCVPICCLHVRILNVAVNCFALVYRISVPFKNSFLLLLCEALYTRYLAIYSHFPHNTYAHLPFCRFNSTTLQSIKFHVAAYVCATFTMYAHFCAMSMGKNCLGKTTFWTINIFPARSSFDFQVGHGSCMCVCVCIVVQANVFVSEWCVCATY